MSDIREQVQADVVLAHKDARICDLNRHEQVAISEGTEEISGL